MERTTSSTRYAGAIRLKNRAFPQFSIYSKFPKRRNKCKNSFEFNIDTCANQVHPDLTDINNFSLPPTPPPPASPILRDSGTHPISLTIAERSRRRARKRKQARLARQIRFAGYLPAKFRANLSIDIGRCAPRDKRASAAGRRGAAATNFNIHA